MKKVKKIGTWNEKTYDENNVRIDAFTLAVNVECTRN